jgi:DNA-3-methyladenine glycosylase
MPPLPVSFYDRQALIVARELLGARLVRCEPGIGRIAGRIVETEAYTGHDDLASHGRLRITKRNAPMWEAPGHAYVYRSRGLHWMLNAVVEPEGQPAAVLIRAIEPLEGLDYIAARRPDRKPLEWTSGPARLAAALGITGDLNRADLTTEEATLWIEADVTIPDSEVRTGPRIGMGKTPEPWYSIPWRFWVGNNPHVSR